MAYSDFTLDDLQRRFQLRLVPKADLFPDAKDIEISPWLTESLASFSDMALATGTEKAKSEFLIAPILGEMRRQLQHQVGLLSGVNLDVDAARGLNGVCDFLITLEPVEFIIRAPIAVVVEAKNDNINNGIPQCLTTMIGAQIYNQRDGLDLGFVDGVVTSGNVWQFLRLERDTALVDRRERYLNDVGRIIGILISIIEHAKRRAATLAGAST